MDLIKKLLVKARVVVMIDGKKDGARQSSWWHPVGRCGTIRERTIIGQKQPCPYDVSPQRSRQDAVVCSPWSAYVMRRRATISRCRTIFSRNGAFDDGTISRNDLSVALFWAVVDLETSHSQIDNRAVFGSISVLVLGHLRKFPMAMRDLGTIRHSRIYFAQNNLEIKSHVNKMWKHLCRWILEKRKVGGIHYEAPSCGHSSPDTWILDIE